MNGLQDLVALIRADTPLIVIETPDEPRVVELFRQSLMHVWRTLFRWSITEGLRRIDMDREDEADVAPDAGATLQAIYRHDQRGVFLLLDFAPYLKYAGTLRQVRDILQRRNCLPHVLVLVGNKVELPEDLEAHAVRYRPKLPASEALLKMVKDEAAAYAREHGGKRVEVDPEAVKQIVRNLRGLSETDARRIARHLIFRDGVLGAEDLPELAKLKFELINRSGHLHYEFDPVKLEHVIGAKRVKRWIELRRAAFVDGNVPPGLDPPKGVLLLGVQGCGKSLCAKAVSNLWQLPLLRFDMGRMFGSFVGSSEENVRRAIVVAESVAPAILWVDEIDKAFPGSQGSGIADGGTTARVFGTFLTWLSEKTAPVFVVATANEIAHLPPELLRKGRLDEIFFVDLPSRAERREIFRIHLARRSRDAAAFDLAALADASDQFSGAEIEEAINSALYDAFYARTDLTTAQVLASIAQTVPLAKTMAEQIGELRTWAEGRAPSANEGGGS